MQHSAAGSGREFASPDAVLTVKIDAEHTAGAYELFEVEAPRGPATPLHRTGWGKAYHVLAGRMMVQVDQEAIEMAPGDSIAIPPSALHTFAVMSHSVRFLVFSLSAGMGRFHADLDATVPRGVPLGEAMGPLREVLGRHDVVVEGIGPVP
jgi:quercetin dioxygenase-like cupin family protein